MEVGVAEFFLNPLKKASPKPFQNICEFFLQFSEILIFKSGSCEKVALTPTL